MDIGEVVDIEQSANSASAFIELGREFLDKKHFAEAEQCYRVAAALSTENNLSSHLATACWQIGYIAQGRWQFNEAELWFKRALRLFELMSETKQVLLTLHNLGLTAFHHGNYKLAEKRIRRALTIELQEGMTRDVAQDYHRLAAIASHCNELERASLFYRRALAIFEELSYPPFSLYTLVELGVLYRKMGHYEQSLTLYAQAWEIAQKYEVEDPIENILAGIVGIFTQAGEKNFIAAWPASYAPPPLKEIRKFRAKLQ